jgi:hypothetical protein
VRDLLKDILFFPVPLIMLIVTPWRVTFLYNIYLEELEKIPLYQNSRKIERQRI